MQVLLGNEKSFGKQVKTWPIYQFIHFIFFWEKALEYEVLKWKVKTLFFLC